MKKIISYSLWGNDPMYTQGALHNANLVAHEFAGWTMRVYHNNTVPVEILNELNRNDKVELVAVDDNRYSWGGLYWRFYVQDDETVSRYIVRDLDCRLSKNDKACIDEWEESGLPFHLMRTVESHATEIMGGLWGCIRSELGIDMKASINDFHINLPPENRGPDQTFLKNTVWPLIKGKCLVHGMDFAYKSGTVKDFIYGYGKRQRIVPAGVSLPAAAGCVFGPEIETWEQGWELDSRVNFDKEEWYNAVRP
jgi:protein O-GlcNAc transferase